MNWCTMRAKKRKKVFYGLIRGNKRIPLVPVSASTNKFTGEKHIMMKEGVPGWQMRPVLSYYKKGV